MVAAAKGYKLLIVMPDSASLERRVMLIAFGAELVLTPGEESNSGAMKVAKRLCEERNGKMLNQFNNPDNVLMHQLTTGPEIFE